MIESKAKQIMARFKKMLELHKSGAPDEAFERKVVIEASVVRDLLVKLTLISRQISGDPAEAAPELALTRQDIISDEHMSGGGFDSAFLPTELFVSSIASCVFSAFVTYAYFAKLHYPNPKLRLTGTFDNRASLSGIDPSMRGLQALNFEFICNVGDSRRMLDRVIKKTMEHCPVYSSLRSGIKTTTSVVDTGKAD